MSVFKFTIWHFSVLPVDVYTLGRKDYVFLPSSRVGGENPSNTSQNPVNFSWVKAVQNISFVGKRKLKKGNILTNTNISSQCLWNPAGFTLFSSRVPNASGFGHKGTQNLMGDLP